MLYEFVVPMDIPPLRLDKLIQKTLPELPNWVIRDAFVRRDVKQNGLRAAPNAMAVAGAQVRVYTSLDTQKPLDVVYEDENILLVNKPYGISVHEDDGVGATMLDRAKKQLGTDSLMLCHRLDNKTCGLLLFAKNDEAERLLRNAFLKRMVEKEYLCLLKGTPRPPKAVKEAYLVKNAQCKKVHIITKPTPGAQNIITGYEVVEAGEVSRVKVALITGRTHQIRAHMAFLGHPILGDDVYGDRGFNKAHKAKRLMLCAARITLNAGGLLSYLDGRCFRVDAPF